jgi:hypothetical protein
LVAVIGLTALAAWAATAVNVTASLTTTCSNCRTDAGGADPTSGGDRPYSLISDGGSYSSLTDSRIQSQILTNNSVYTLDTSNTLEGGLVGFNTRFVSMHFYSSVECKPGQTGCDYPNNILPPCWGGNYDQNQAVNWSIFAPTSFLRMKAGTKYQGMARLNFNVRNEACDRQLNRFRLEWGAVCITTNSTTTAWTVTSGTCVTTDVNYGEAHLQAYGGTKKNTVDYGDWRMPFQLTLVKP